MQTAWLYAKSGRRIEADLGRELAKTATYVSRLWRRPDAGIWEVRSPPQHFTQSKMMCWVALERALRLAQEGHIPGDDVPRWRVEARAIAQFVEHQCWSADRCAYARYPGSDELDASLLLGVLFAYPEAHDERMRATVAAIRQERARGPYVMRYTGRRRDERP